MGEKSKTRALYKRWFSVGWTLATVGEAGGIFINCCKARRSSFLIPELHRNVIIQSMFRPSYNPWTVPTTCCSLSRFSFCCCTNRPTMARRSTSIVHFSAARMEMLRSDTARPTLNQNSSPQQTAATTSDTAPAMPCLIMKRYTTAQPTFKHRSGNASEASKVTAFA